MSLGYPNQNGGRTTDAALFHGLGNIFTGTWISGFRVRQNSPLGMSVQIGGESTVPDDLLVRDGTGAVFPVFNMSSQPVVATVPAANSANPRIDTVVVYIDNSIAADHASENNQNRTKVIVIAGAPATNPSAPSASQIKSVIGSNSPYTVLADVRVNRGATSISNSNITDRRWAVKLRHSPIIDNAWQLKNDIVLPQHIDWERLMAAKFNTASSVPSAPMIQYGRSRIDGNGALEASGWISFPKAFNPGSVPVVLCTYTGYTSKSSPYRDSPTGGWAGVTVAATGTLHGGFSAIVRRVDGATLSDAYYFNWIAIGEA